MGWAGFDHSMSEVFPLSRIQGSGNWWIHPIQVSELNVSGALGYILCLNYNGPDWQQITHVPRAS
jgi:hypothetical protein